MMEMVEKNVMERERKIGSGSFWVCDAWLGGRWVGKRNDWCSLIVMRLTFVAFFDFRHFLGWSISTGW